jgi:hypothetical protein
LQLLRSSDNHPRVFPVAAATIDAGLSLFRGNGGMGEKSPIITCAPGMGSNSAVKVRYALGSRKR